MSETYDSYEMEFLELCDEISQQCVSTAFVTGEEKKQLRLDIRKGLDKAENLIRRMNLETRTLKAVQKAALLAGLSSHKADLSYLQREAQKTLAARENFAARDELMEGGMVDSNTLSADQRGRPLTATERSNQSGEQIKDSIRTVLETESLNMSTLGDLDSQRQTLLHGQDEMIAVNEHVRKSLIKMTRLMYQYRLISCGLLSTLIFVIVLLVLYFIFK